MENNTETAPEGVEGTDTSVDTSTDTNTEGQDTNTEPHYTDYQEDNYEVPTNPEDDPESQEKEEDDVDEESLHEMMTEYMREKFELPEKFKDVEGLINSYKHLESKMGSMKGAPEQYELDENVIDYFGEDMMSGITEEAQRLGIDNDGLETLLSKAAEVSQKEQEANWEMELQKLGPNAKEQVAKDLQYINQNFAPEMAETLQGMVQTADQYQALHSLVMDHRNGNNPTPAAQTPASTPVTQSQIDEMLFAKDSHGNLRMESDPAYEKKVIGMMNQLN